MLKALLLAAALLAAGPAAAFEALQLRVDHAEATTDPVTGDDIVEIQFDAKSTEALADFTRRNVGHTVDIAVDQELISSPVIREPILGGVVYISGSMTDLDTHFMALRLNAKKAVVKMIVDVR